MEYLLKIKDYVLDHKEELLKKGGVILITCIVLFSIYYFNVLKTDNNLDEQVKTEIITKKEESKEPIVGEVINNLTVDIKGFVKKPGVYSLKDNSRIIDVINLAEGLLDTADTSVINLSLKLKDEMVIIIYSKDQVTNFKETKKTEDIVNDNCKNDNLNNSGCINDNNNTNKDESTNIDESGKVNDKVNINTASLELLETLPGVGEGKALDIINYRKNNVFIIIDDLKKVPGIGDLTFDKIKDYITV